MTTARAPSSATATDCRDARRGGAAGAVLGAGARTRLFAVLEVALKWNGPGLARKGFDTPKTRLTFATNMKFTRYAFQFAAASYYFSRPGLERLSG